MSGAQVEIFTTGWCGFCQRAKALLERKGVDFTEYRVDETPELREQMLARSGGARTVPQIFIGGEHIGGCDELYLLEHEGKLDVRLATTN